MISLGRLGVDSAQHGHTDHASAMCQWPKSHGGHIPYSLYQEVGLTALRGQGSGLGVEGTWLVHVRGAGAAHQSMEVHAMWRDACEIYISEKQ